MKTIATIATSIFLLVPLFSISQWTWLNPKPTGNYNSKIIFTDSQLGFILQSDGTLLKTVDQGKNWNIQQNFPNTLTINFLDSTGIIGGYFGNLYISKNNGRDWESKYTGYSYALTMSDVVNRDTLFLANENGKIFRSDDRGETWKMFDCGFQIRSMDFVNSKIGYIGCSSTYILKTEDGGETWQKVQTSSVYPSETTAIHFIDSNTGFAFRTHSDMLSTTDGGKTWNIFYMGDYIYSMYFVDKNNGLAVGEHGAMYRTNDGGASWDWISPNGRIFAYDLKSVYFIDAKVGFAVGARGRILKTTDGGNTWNTYATSYLDVKDISIPTYNVAYALAGNTIIKTTNHGNTWEELPFKVGVNYADNSTFQTCHFFNADTGFVTKSNYAELYKTYDGGKSWKSMQPTEYSFDYVSCIQFLNNNIGYLNASIFYGSQLVKTTDGGESWTAIWSSQYFGQTFQKFFFVDEKTGYASQNNMLYKTEDSAKSWVQLWQDQQISTLCFANEKTGCVAGENGMLKLTTDSGKTWQNIKISDQFYDDIYDIKFVTDRVGYLTAEGGTIYKTIDGGTTWKKNSNNSFYQLPVIRVAKDSSVYVAGQYGAILRTDDISEFAIDSLVADIKTNCETDFNAVVTAVYKPVDSIRFEYGINNFSQTSPASPSTINNNTQYVAAKATGLKPATFYQVRIALFFNGKYSYSSPYIFRTQDAPVKPEIIAQGNTTFCDGDSVILKSSALYGNTWLFDGHPLPDSPNQSIIAKQQGTYQLFQKEQCYNSDTTGIDVLIHAIPERPIISLENSILTSSALTGNQWYFGDSTIVGATQPSLSPTANGLYKVGVVDNNCVSALSEPFNFFSSSSLEKGILLGPNPTADLLNIKYQGSSPSKLTLLLFDDSGRQKLRTEFTTNVTINMSSYPSGVYIVRIVDPQTGQHVSRKIIR